MPFFRIDSYYIYLILPAMIIAIIAQINVKSTFNKYKKLSNSRGYTGYQVARQILDENGLNNVKIERVTGELSDHFDPRTNIIRLSDSTYSSDSVGAIGVASHEVGHAIQYNVGYFPIKIRAAIIPITNIGSTMAIPLAMIGIIFSAPILINIGIILFLSVVTFQLVTLPVEFNASNRAIKTLKNRNILYGQELVGAKKVLSAAAMTYVAALIVSLANLIRLIALSNRNR